MTASFSGTPRAYHAHTADTPSTWVVDSGASDHMTGEKDLFTSSIQPFHKHVHLIEGTFTPILSKSDICLSTNITLYSVLLVPNFAVNLLSDNRLAKKF